MEKNKIQNIILDYCEGHEHLEFSKSDLPEMVEKIKEAVLHEFEDAEDFVGGLDDARDNVKDYL